MSLGSVVAVVACLGRSMSDTRLSVRLLKANLLRMFHCLVRTCKHLDVGVG